MLFTAEAESNYLRQVSTNSTPVESKELYRQGTTKQQQPMKDEGSMEETRSLNQMTSNERIGSSKMTTPRQPSSAIESKTKSSFIIKTER